MSKRMRQIIVAVFAVGGLLFVAPQAMARPSGKLPASHTKHIDKSHQQTTPVRTVQSIHTHGFSGWWLPPKATVAQR